jgi:hypothetical protein
MYSVVHGIGFWPWVKQVGNATQTGSCVDRGTHTVGASG